MNIIKPIFTPHPSSPKGGGAESVLTPKLRIPPNLLEKQSGLYSPLWRGIWRSRGVGCNLLPMGEATNICRNFHTC